MMKPTLYHIELIGNGFLAVMAKPVSGEWIDDEFRGIALEGVRQVVSLLETAESYEVGLDRESEYCQKYEMEFSSYPIKNGGLPPSVPGFSGFTRRLYDDCVKEKNTVIHCRAGIGRTGLVAGGVLTHAGSDPKNAFEKISKARGVTVPDTEEQYQWLVEHARAITSVV